MDYTPEQELAIAWTPRASPSAADTSFTQSNVTTMQPDSTVTVTNPYNTQTLPDTIVIHCDRH